jgi:hypothetical protein
LASGFEQCGKRCWQSANLPKSALGNNDGGRQIARRNQLLHSDLRPLEFS